ncbi:hypothetical protein [Flavobacterium enshiense]|uniref:Thioredoxin domain-containing protein n=1 Tax=Flavobacterium enshiense DK69 TaxID=1107311 RepID=A0A0A2MWS5_9FLAO|nr:hypothetical protein [Flavobacterium enshiense]KGO96066.1 hypothetical protein Q767_07325 [Flavobacterium enshiense DK69]
MKIKTLLLFVLFSNFLFSQEHLKAGSKARKIYISDWITNKPKDTILEGKNIVLLFWDPSNTSQFFGNKKVDYIKEINSLQEKMQRKDLCFISMTPADAVTYLKSYLKNNEFKTIAVIDKTKRTQRGFGNKDGSIFLPLVILIDKNGIMKWIGIPYSLDEKILNKFLDGSLNPYSQFDLYTPN